MRLNLILLKPGEARGRYHKPLLRSCVSECTGPLGKEPALNLPDSAPQGHLCQPWGARRGQPPSAQITEGQVPGHAVAPEQD